MFAIVEIAGSQVKVAERERVYVPKLAAEIGTQLKFDTVLLKSSNNETVVGAPYIENSFVEATVVRHIKDEKVVVFKKKRRKGYKVRKGHRQHYTELEILKVV
ncbi:MAG: 50S ribosomal protein L21 [Bacteroidetes bacterium]|nr:50S ribosomal protein L21 [Bacteroidota bacterium]